MKCSVPRPQPGAQFNEADQVRISALEKDVRLKGRAFSEVAAGDAPDRYPEVKVIVKTLRAGSPILNLRIYYVPEASKGRKARSSHSGSSPPHPIKNFRKQIIVSGRP